MTTISTSTAIAVTEPSCGSDVSRLRTEARTVPGGWRIRGEKIAITLATAASVALVYAREPGSEGYRGISCFAVPLEAEGRVQREGEVLHLVVSRLLDRSKLLGALLARSRDFH